MKKQMRCIVSAAVSAALIICTVDYTCYRGREAKVKREQTLEAAQNEVIVQDFIHDNYVISERNPWTDYGLHAINYSYSKSAAAFTQKIDAQAAILVDANSNTVLYEKQSEKKMYPASTTKLMTALTVLQNLRLTDVVTVGSEVSMIASDSSRAGFSIGQIVTVEELLEGLLISSGNDAAYILAKATGEHILEDNIENEGKTFSAEQCVQRFVYEMNKNVRDMELKNTKFTSPDGYDNPEQYTTASDLSKIAIRAYQKKEIAKICRMERKYSKTLKKTWTSTNALLDENGGYYYEDCRGLKTGSTDLAGKCLVSAAADEKNACICVVLNDTTDEQRWHDSKSLLSYGLENSNK